MEVGQITLKSVNNEKTEADIDEIIGDAIFRKTLSKIRIFKYFEKGFNYFLFHTLMQRYRRYLFRKFEENLVLSLNFRQKMVILQILLLEYWQKQKFCPSLEVRGGFRNQKSEESKLIKLPDVSF